MSTISNFELPVIHDSPEGIFAKQSSAGDV